MTRRLFGLACIIAIGCGGEKPGHPTPEYALTALVDDSGLPSDAGPRATVGEMGPTVAWPIIGIHVALAPSGKLLTFQGDFQVTGEQYMWDPGAPNAPQHLPNSVTNLFCAGQPVLADGRVLVLGGTHNHDPGIKNVTAFDPIAEVWEAWPSMRYARWYGTGITLGDGNVLVMSGTNERSIISSIPEILNVQTRTWSDVTNAASEVPIYPFLAQLADGRVLWSGASEVATQTKVLDLSTQLWTTLDGGATRDGSSMTQFELGKFLKSGSATDDGGSGNSVATAYVLDMNQPTPVWQPTSPMSFARSFENLTTLPDGTVLVTGGDTTKSGSSDADAVLPSEIWDPANGQWTTVASVSEAREYHSTAILLPDGRVWISGGGGDPPTTTVDHLSYQIYSPPYLFKGPRPVTSAVPGSATYGGTMFVGTPNTDIMRVALIRTGSVTHAFDQNARSMTLAFSATAGGYDVTMPANGNVAPPGYYMLFLVNDNGVPSMGQFVRFPAPWEVVPDAGAEPIPEPAPEAGPEPIAEAGPEPVAEAGPEPVAEAGPEPVAEAGPNPVAEAEPEPVTEAGPNPVAEAGPEPVTEAGPDAVDARADVIDAASELEAGSMLDASSDASEAGAVADAGAAGAAGSRGGAGGSAGSGATGTGGTASGGTAGSPDAGSPPSEESSGCACSSAGTQRHGSPGASLLLIGGLLSLRRRRRST